MRVFRLLVVGAVVVTAAGCGSALRVEQVMSPKFGDLTAMQTVEITDWAGTVLLSGTLSAPQEVKGRIERTAELTSPTNAVSRGTVKVEIDRRGGISDEEFRVRVFDLPYPTSCKLLVDGRQLTMFSSAEEGEVLVKLTRRVVPGTDVKQP